ncbi:MAG: hypothetical protein K6U80_03935 [Firmicutes bacterium]|nr:hypothetical protein [Bacillota bacterium]
MIAREADLWLAALLFGLLLREFAGVFALEAKYSFLIKYSFIKRMAKGSEMLEKNK